MRILHVVKKYPNVIAGDAVCVSYLEKEQTKNGHQVFILTINCPQIISKPNLYKFGLKDDSYAWDSVNIKRILSLFLLYFKSLIILKKIKPDIIYSHSADLGFIVSLWARLLGITIINTCHTLNFPYNFINKTKRVAEWLALKFGFFDKIITVDPKGVEFFPKYGIKNCEYLSMVGVDIEAFDKVRRNVHRDEKNNKTKFLFVGRLDALKGLDYLIQAASQLRAHTEDFEVWIVGDGLCKGSLQKLSYELNINEKINFLGAIYSREKLIEIYCLADIFVLPSLLENFSLVILEAWAAGLPVIATNQGGIASIGKNHENVLIVPIKDATSLSGAMSELISDESLRKKIAFNGRKLVENNFTWEIAIKNLDEIRVN